MNKICKAIFRAIHEGKWLQIEYLNKENKITKFWVGIHDLNWKRKYLSVDGMHMVQGTLDNYDWIYIDRIQSAVVIDGSYQQKNERLIADIKYNSENYEVLFGNVANLKILNYLEECNKLDTTPYYTDYALLKYFDGDRLQRSAIEGSYRLTDEQYHALIKQFTGDASKSNQMKKIELGLNVLSVHVPKQKGLYVLAYQKLLFDIKARCLRPDDEITVCYEYELLERKQSIRQFLDADDYGLLDKFEENLELIKDRITQSNRWTKGVDDMPYMIAIGRNHHVDLNMEYNEIIQMYEEDRVTMPIRAFFGDLLARPVRRKEYPFAILNKQINLDQLLAVNNAMKYPLAYVQGPPGTGKTNTIINTIATAFFNERTVLFSSYNNHPIDGVFDKLRSLNCKYGRIPFPIVRLGNREKVTEALGYMRNLYCEVQKIRVLEENLEKNKMRETEKVHALCQLLKRYEELIELQEKKETLKKLEDTQQKHFTFYADLHDRQFRQIKDRQNELGKVSVEEALRLLPQDEKYLMNYLYFASAKYIKRLDEPKNERLKNIILSEAEDRIEQFNQYLSDEKNVEQF